MEVDGVVAQEQGPGVEGRDVGGRDSGGGGPSWTGGAFDSETVSEGLPGLLVPVVVETSARTGLGLFVSDNVQKGSTRMKRWRRRRSRNRSLLLLAT